MFLNPPIEPPEIPDVTAREACDLQSARQAIIVDVRDRDAWTEARIPGALHIPLDELTPRLSELPRDRMIITQCRSGNRSYLAAQTLVGAGFRDVRNLDGGIVDWAAAKLPVER